MEMMDLNQEDEMQETLLQEEKVYPSFWERHRYGIGMISGILTMTVAIVLVIVYIAFSGKTLVIGGKNVATEVKDNIILDEETIDKINEIYAYLNIYYYDEYELEDIRESVYKGVMKGLEDPYSVYYIIIRNIKEEMTMEVVISKVYRGTPAEEAGLMNGDQVLKVNDIDATSMELSDLVQNIRGDEGTTVYMMIYRESTQETLEFNVERRYVELPSIEGEMLANGIGYIQITEFQSKTAEQFDAMVAELKEQGMKGLILDVRANPGGYLSAVVDILDSILPEGLLVYTEDKYGVRKEYNSDSACMEMPLVVMIDESSASASEILAGAIKDYEYGTLIGKTTFGKGIVQNILQLSDGDAVKLTTSKYFTPKGNYIHEVGIAPDIEVEYEYSGSKEESYQKEYDSQFIKALEIMEGMLAQ